MGTPSVYVPYIKKKLNLLLSTLPTEAINTEVALPLLHFNREQQQQRLQPSTYDNHCFCLAASLTAHCLYIILQ
jgi:hypothetical protein